MVYSLLTDLKCERGRAARNGSTVLVLLQVASLQEVAVEFALAAWERFCSHARRVRHFHSTSS